MANRSIFFDNTKFLLIMLVILGHVLPINFHYPLERGLYNFIFFFHMPLFIFISGYFTNVNKGKGKFLASILRIGETLICFQFLHYLLKFILGDELTLKSLIIPQYTLWYLLCLLYWRIILFIFKPSTNSYKAIVISLILFILAGFIPLTSALAFQRTFFFFPFFLLGYYTKNLTRTNLPKIPYTLGLSFIIMILGISIISAIISIPPLVYNQDLLYGQINYTALSYPLWFSILLRLFYLINALFISICFLSIVPQKETFYTKYGKDTLFFYVYHSILIIILRYLVEEYNLPKNFISCLIYFIIIVFLLFLMKRVSFFHFMVNPFSYKSK